MHLQLSKYSTSCILLMIHLQAHALLLSIFSMSSLNSGCWASSKMKFIQVAVFLALIFLLCLGLVAPVAGRGPPILGIPQPWNFTMAECYLFRNESNLRPFFYLWPESIEGVPFSYCCEYLPQDQPLSPALFDLSHYGSRYTPSSSDSLNNLDIHFLVPAPYYDLGIIDKHFEVYMLSHFGWSDLPFRLRAPYRPPLFCEASDLYRLYKHRLNQAFLRAVRIAAVLIGIIYVAFFVFRVYILCLAICHFYPEHIPSDLLRELRKVQWGELVLDVLHVVLIAFVGTFLMEAIGHSNIREWRSQLMYNAGIVYWLLTLIVVAGGAARHGLLSQKRDNMEKSVELLVKKLFAQSAALFMICTYLSLVDDVTGHRLDAVAGLTLGAVLGASAFSVMEYEWVALVLIYFSMKFTEPNKCSVCREPKIKMCRHEALQAARAAEAHAVLAGMTAGGPSARL